MNHIIPHDVLCYLATPYSKYPGGIEKAFQDASALAAKLLRLGVSVYSPIAHTHPIAVYGNIDPHDHDIWLPFDEAMMRACEYLLVAEMPGWQESKGIAYEIAFFERSGKAVYHIDAEGGAIRQRVSLGGEKWSPKGDVAND